MNIFKQYFERYLNARKSKNLFRRRSILESMPREKRQQRPSDTLNRRLLSEARLDLPQLLAQLGTSVQGLTDAEAEELLEQHGFNEVEHESAVRWWRHLWLSYNNPFNLLLTLLALVSIFTKDLQGAVVITVMVVLATLLRFFQERRSNQAAKALKERVSNTASVRRRASDSVEVSVRHLLEDTTEIPIKELVPGDIVHLSAGDMIPADCRLLTATDLFLSQSGMTGESLPVEKFVAVKSTTESALEMDNLVFMGTNVISGTASAVVLATGNSTYFGTLARRVTRAATADDINAFQLGVNKVSWLLIRFALIMVPLVLFINGFSKGDWPEALLFALSVAVGLTPEMLPMIVTSTMARGAVMLSRRQVIVKRLDAIQSFGAMDVLCTDKTGTLTQDKIALARHIDVAGNQSDEVLGFAYLNSYFQTGLKNLLDRAVLDHVELKTELDVVRDYRKVDEIPFDFARRRMSVVVSEREEHHELISKGAAEEMFNVCSHVQYDGQVYPLDASREARLKEVLRELNESGLRVIAVAMKEIPPDQTVYSKADESGLTLIGYIAFLDPPKESTAPALQALAAHGVDVKIITGDNELVAAEVSRQVGLEVKGLLLGAQIDAMDERTLAQVVEGITIFARMSPLNKERVVYCLRDLGHVVGFMGDGVNDAPALRAADIGISVDGAVDIAKEAADIILLERSLMVLKDGVIEGRKTFSNMLKYIRMTVSSNFGNVFSIVIASIFLPFLPMLPLQLLVQNLLYDISQIAIPFDNVDEEEVSQPLKWNADGIGRFMLFFGPLSSIFDVLTFALMWYVFMANTVAEQALFQSGWFVVGLLTQTMIVHIIRTPKMAFIESRAAAPLIAATLAIMAVGIFLPMGPLASYFKMQALPWTFFIWLLAILIGYGALTSLMKRYYIRRFGWH
ncbi:MAG TPA: magnesium-translocating P-type ATPase [Gammaproteobacteria bacterium]|nr:magnesium-translocating P-type ATPase [Gammaproteobacteria bacterium]